MAVIASPEVMVDSKTSPAPIVLRDRAHVGNGGQGAQQEMVDKFHSLEAIDSAW